MNNQETNTQTVAIEDLAAQNANEIKGGPNPKSKRTVVLQSSATEAQTEVQRVTSTGLANNHNEAVVADEDEEAETIASLADLEISTAQVEQTKGGPTKRVWDYIRVS